MARPREFDADIVLSQMRDAFWESGYEATSLSDLVEATGVQKASLYAAFGSKQQMYCKALADYERTHVKTTVALMADLRGREALNALFYAPADAVAGGDLRGCFLCNSSAEHLSLDADAREISQRGLVAMQDSIGKALAEAGIQTVHPGEVLAIYFGMRVLARSGASEAGLRAIARSAIDRI